MNRNWAGVCERLRDVDSFIRLFLCVFIHKLAGALSSIGGGNALTQGSSLCAARWQPQGTAQPEDGLTSVSTAS